MDGLLIVDKPVGPSSHDVVARVRRVLGERRIGHTGTLDPLASGVLPLVLGRATRLARFLSSDNKTYEAVIRLGVSTTSYDAQGTPSSPAYDGPLPARDAIDRALDAFRGTFTQRPPVFSAKKIGGHPSYRLARRAARLARVGHDRGLAPSTEPAPMELAPVEVIVHSIQLLGVDRDLVRLEVQCGAGFYVRSLAHDLGERLGTGAHLAGLRRTRSGDSTLDRAITLEVLEHPADGKGHGVDAVIPMSHMLPALDEVALTEEGVRHAGHGRDLAPRDFLGNQAPVPRDAASTPDGLPDRLPYRLPYRLVDGRGNLVGLAAPAKTPGFLHPFVILM